MAAPTTVMCFWANVLPLHIDDPIPHGLSVPYRAATLPVVGFRSRKRSGINLSGSANMAGSLLVSEMGMEMKEPAWS